ncbi:MAG: 50S ribosomal protein L25 [Gemmatimonadetes bacterium]|nr:50S ribosomal protein L25 [Gemmatimonadota bacterium]
MSIEATLNAEPREAVRKGANRKLRATGRVPAVLYGKDHAPTLLSVDAREAERLFQQISVENTVIEIKLKGGTTKIQALVREVQVAAVRPDLIHIDFYKIQAGVTLEVEIPIELIGVPNGVRHDGGILEQLLHEIPVRCLPDAIPERIEIDVTELGLHDSFHVSDLKVAEGIEILMDPERTLCLVSVPRAVVEAVAPTDAPVTEVIGADKTEGAEGGAEG